MRIGGNFNLFPNYNHYASRNQRIMARQHKEKKTPKKDESLDGSMLVDHKEQQVVEENFWRHGINTIVFAVKEGVANHIVNRLEPIKEKIKVGIHTALKRFGKESHPFGTLTDPGTGSLLDSREGRDSKQDKKEQGTRANASATESVMLTEDHLMDSYSKSGKYCKLNENLTYRQGREPYKVSERSEQEKQGDSF